MVDITLSSELWRVCGAGNESNTIWELYDGYSLINTTV